MAEVSIDPSFFSLVRSLSDTPPLRLLALFADAISDSHDRARARRHHPCVVRESGPRRICISLSGWSGGEEE